MEYEVLGPIRGSFGTAIYATLVRARGHGSPSDPERLEQELAVALPGNDITIDLRAVDELGPDGMAALERIAGMVADWPSGRLFLLATPDEVVWDELQSLEHGRVWIEAVGKP